MKKIGWTPDLSVGIDVVDKQHQRIIDYINELIDAQTNHSREKVAEVLNQTVDYTLSHFAFEENLMEEAGYPFVNAHKKVHQLFTKRVLDYQQRFAMGDDIAEELLNTLRAWLINHIRNDDHDYGDVVRANLDNLEKKKEGWIKRFFG